MSQPTTNHILSSRSMKLIAGGVSLPALALLAMLAVGLFADDPELTATDGTPTSQDAVVSASGGPALHAAISEDDSEMVRILVEGGADVDARNYFGGPALHVAIDGENREMVRILVAAGADVDAKDSFGDSVLHRAILGGDSDLVRILVDAGANVNITNAFGDSALSRAVQEGNKEILQILADARDN